MKLFVTLKKLIDRIGLKGASSKKTSNTNRDTQDETDNRQISSLYTDNFRNDSSSLDGAHGRDESIEMFVRRNFTSFCDEHDGSSISSVTISSLLGVPDDELGSSDYADKELNDKLATSARPHHKEKIYFTNLPKNITRNKVDIRKQLAQRMFSTIQEQQEQRQIYADKCSRVKDKLLRRRKKLQKKIRIN